MMTHHFRVTNKISPSEKNLMSDNRNWIINKFSFVHYTFISQWWHLKYTTSLSFKSRLFVQVGCGSEVVRYQGPGILYPHMLRLRLTLKHCNCHISQELIWSGPEPESCSSPPPLRTSEAPIIPETPGTHTFIIITKPPSPPTSNLWTHGHRTDILNYPHFKMYVCEAS